MQLSPRLSARRIPAFFLLAVVSILMVVSTLAISPAFAERKPLDKVIAIVDDNVILKSEQDSRVRTVIARLNAQGTPLPSRKVLSERVLDQLILDSIQLQMADRMGMRVSDNELNDTMKNIAGRNGYTLDEFEDVLASEGLTYREAREQIRKEMLVSRVQQRQVDGRVRTTKREVNNFLQAQSGEKETGVEYKLGQILVSVDDYNDKKEVAAARKKIGGLRQRILNGTDFRQVAVAESDGANALGGGVLGWRTKNQLPSLVAGVAPNLDIREPSKVLQSGSGFHLVTIFDKRGGDTGKMIEQAYVRHILVRTTDARTDEQAEARINDIHKQLENDADFATLARESSDDKVSGSDGGNLGWVGPGEMVPAFEEAMKNAKTGKLKGPFRSRFGWHILQVQERRKKDIGDQLKETEARQVLYRRKFEIELQKWLGEIREEAYVDIKGKADEGDADSDKPEPDAS